MKNLKIFFTGVLFLLSYGAGFGQSPYYSIDVGLIEQAGYNYTYTSKLCSEKDYRWPEDIFSHVMSERDWRDVNISNYECSELYNESDTGFHYGNHIYAFESIGSVRIDREKDGKVETMRIVFPIAMKAFVTFVELRLTEFKEGMYDITDGLEYDTTHHLKITVRQGYEWSEIKESSLWRE